MRDAGILDGDLLAVHRTPVAENGQIVVVRLTDHTPMLGDLLVRSRDFH